MAFVYAITMIVTAGVGWGSPHEPGWASVLPAVALGSFAHITGIAVGIGAVVGGTNDPVLIAGATLAVAALFGPARRRIQALLDRRFYRRRYDLERTLATFTAGLRDEVDLEQVRDRLVATVRQTLAPDAAFVWMRSGRPARLTPPAAAAQE